MAHHTTFACRGNYYTKYLLSLARRFASTSVGFWELSTWRLLEVFLLWYRLALLLLPLFCPDLLWCGSSYDTLQRILETEPGHLHAICFVCLHFSLPLLLKEGKYNVNSCHPGLIGCTDSIQVIWQSMTKCATLTISHCHRNWCTDGRITADPPRGN